MRVGTVRPVVVVIALIVWTLVFVYTQLFRTGGSGAIGPGFWVPAGTWLVGTLIILLVARANRHRS